MWAKFISSFWIKVRQSIFLIGLALNAKWKFRYKHLFQNSFSVNIHCSPALDYIKFFLLEISPWKQLGEEECLGGHCLPASLLFRKDLLWMVGIRLEELGVLVWLWRTELLLFSHSVASDSLWHRGLQHARLLCPSLSPGVCSNSCPLSWWCHLTLSSSFVLFSSCHYSFPASESFPMSPFFTSDGQSIGASASASVLPMNI